MKKAALALAGLAVGFVAGYGTGRVSTGTPINPLSVGKGGYEEGYKAAVKDAVATGLLPPTPTESSSISGTVVSADAAAVVFEVISPNPIAKIEGPARRTARITAETKFMRAEQANPEEFAAAAAAFQAAMDAGETALPPSPTTLVPYAEPIKAGDVITVEASGNVLPAASFDALTIIVSPAP